MKITLTVIKADVGGIGGHTRPSDGLLNAVRNVVRSQVRRDGKGLLIDSYIGYSGDDIHIVMTHTSGVDNREIHQLAWKAFEAATRVAQNEGLYGAGQDLLKDSFSGNIKKDPTKPLPYMLQIRLNQVPSTIRFIEFL